MRIETRFNPGDAVAYFPRVDYMCNPVLKHIKQVVMTDYNNNVPMYELQGELTLISEEDVFVDYAEAYKSRISYLTDMLKVVE